MNLIHNTPRVSSLSFPSKKLLQEMTDVVGSNNVVDPNHADIGTYAYETSGAPQHTPALVLHPASTEEVSQILALAHVNKVGVVPQGGRTGRVGGTALTEPDRQIVVTTTRLRALREFDTTGSTITVEAGMTPDAVCDIASESGLMFPLHIGSHNQCTIGGNLATNAGGISAFRYGSMRDMVLGLELVLPSGQIVHGLRALRKDNTGFDLKNLFIGSEGSLGIITAAVLRLFPSPQSTATVLIGIASLEAALWVYEFAQRSFGPDLTAFELMPFNALTATAEHLGQSLPMTLNCPYYVLLENASQLDVMSDTGTGKSMNDLIERLELALDKVHQNGTIVDAVLAYSEQQRANLWRLRHAMPEVARARGTVARHDISVPISALPELFSRASSAVLNVLAEAVITPFGHVGDGNIHFNVSAPLSMDNKEFAALIPKINEAVYEVVIALNGSIAAEHGIGLQKTGLMSRARSGTEISIMRAIKHAIDPAGIMNPGKAI